MPTNYNNGRRYRIDALNNNVVHEWFNNNFSVFEDIEKNVNYFYYYKTKYNNLKFVDYLNCYDHK